MMPWMMFNDGLGDYIMDWVDDKHDYVKWAILAESLEWSGIVYFTWLIGIKAIDDIYWWLEYHVVS